MVFDFENKGQSLYGVDVRLVEFEDEVALQ
jgi:hypothetical protein